MAWVVRTPEHSKRFATLKEALDYVFDELEDRYLTVSKTELGYCFEEYDGTVYSIEVAPEGQPDAGVRVMRIHIHNGQNVGGDV